MQTAIAVVWYLIVTLNGALPQHYKDMEYPTQDACESAKTDYLIANPTGHADCIKHMIRPGRLHLSQIPGA